MKVGVTGATGFIGGHVVDELQRRAHEVRAFGSRMLDVTQPATLDALAGCDAVVHAGAYLPRALDDAGEAARCMTVNALGTLAVLDACKRLGVAHTVLLSGGNIYRLSATPVAEDAPIDPSHRAVYYLTSKACADHFATHFDRDEGVPVCILRPAAVYGPRIARSMIATFTTKLLAGEPITIDNGGAYRADFVEVGDVAAATVDALERGVRGPLNLGSGTTTSVLEIAQLLVELCAADPALVRIAPPSGQAAGFSQLEITRARTLLGFAPRTIREGLARYVAWRRETL